MASKNQSHEYCGSLFPPDASLFTLSHNIYAYNFKNIWSKRRKSLNTFKIRLLLSTVTASVKVCSCVHLLTKPVRKSCWQERGFLVSFWFQGLHLRMLVVMAITWKICSVQHHKLIKLLVFQPRLEGLHEAIHAKSLLVDGIIVVMSFILLCRISSCIKHS